MKSSPERNHSRNIRRYVFSLFAGRGSSRDSGRRIPGADRAKPPGSGQNHIGRRARKHRPTVVDRPSRRCRQTRFGRCPDVPVAISLQDEIGALKSLLSSFFFFLFNYFFSLFFLVYGKQKFIFRLGINSCITLKKIEMSRTKK